MNRAVRNLVVAVICNAMLSVTGANIPPTLTNFKRSLVIPENTATGTVLTTLTARDVDGPSPVTFDTASPETGHLARLSPSRPAGAHAWSADVILKVKLDSDFESNQRKLFFKVSDGQTEVSVTATLFITDVNDCVPQFQNLPDSTAIDESTGVGSSVFQVTATDPDRGSGGAISFSLENDYEGTFSIDRYYGKVIVAKPLDFESKSLFRLLVNATDGGGLSSQAELRVAVTDVQDSPPFFLRNAYSASVLENSPVGTSVVKVSAVDGDLAAQNAVSYQLESNSCGGLFAVDVTSGTVTVSGKVDREDARILKLDGICDLNITATEISTHLPQMGPSTSWVAVTVYVDDVNDHKPLFSAKRVDAWTSRNAPRAAPLTFRRPAFLVVKDEDKGENGRLELYLKMVKTEYEGMFDLVPTEAYSQTQILIRVLNTTALRSYRHNQIAIGLFAREKSASQREAYVTIDVNVDDLSCADAAAAAGVTSQPFG